uniref:NADH-ubiquinone oxidoreductase chain 4L n=1 Tax=Megacopta cribraria TaxID=299257 RepID=F2YJ79_MEGCI|nr:NADH dehydrogenase subunit 4L [Megacopta cribraria]ADZ23060.1 NADH dehydrogenase subunit 4L [Megacopta cribraria]UYA97261.1 NADH dehydrogenase subunit 4L [Megacopta cribraria]UYA97274.1 NADH dehydrogenase subunit 4L [Megacopta cribraria]UYA97287.1 NADH dehydrogenase subunit 4L [Megacopta cribraria]UYA97300.1 NADH dehydrogenase subunit 4L [Megacopta cribraria]
MLSIMNLSMVFMFSGVLVFCLNRKHILLALLSLEFMVLSVYFILYMFLTFSGYELYYSMIFLVFSVCEGALGLSILVNFVRTSGNDYVSSVSMLSW